MNILYEEDGSFKVGSIMTDNTTSLQIESLSGKRSKVKAANVMLRFTQPALAEFMAQAEALAETIDVEFLWECCPPEEFGSEQIAAEYFGHTPSALEAAAALIRLHGAPIYFHKKGKGRYRAAPPDVLKAALAGAEKKRQQLALQARYTEQLTRFELPAGVRRTTCRICCTSRTATPSRSRRWKPPAPRRTFPPRTCCIAAARCLPRTITICKNSCSSISPKAPASRRSN